VQAASLATVETTMLHSTRTEVRLILTHVACAPNPIIPTTLFLGGILVPPKFFGEWKIITFFVSSAAKITVSISLTNDFIFLKSELFELSVLLYACMFLLPLSLLMWLVNQSLQLGCNCMMFFICFRLLSNSIVWTGCSSCCNQKARWK
jgi:hypothetical protein